MWWLKIISAVVLFAIVYQDLKYRAVSWFWFPILAIGLGTLHYLNSLFEVFVLHSLINLGFVLLILILLYAYISFRGKYKFSKAMGSGDVVMFIALSPAMASITFIVCFIFSILLAMILSLVFNKKDKKNIPLAGYMAVFFIFIYLAYWNGFLTQLYTI